MQIAILVYLIIEAINIIYTSKFGFSPIESQPFAYRSVRKVSIVSRHLLVIIIFLTSFNSSLFVGIIFLLAPFIIDKIIFQFCKRREKKRLAKLYMSKEDNPKPMLKKEAEKTANTMIEMYSKNKEYAF